MTLHNSPKLNSNGLNLTGGQGVAANFGNFNGSYTYHDSVPFFNDGLEWSPGYWIKNGSSTDSFARDIDGVWWGGSSGNRKAYNCNTGDIPYGPAPAWSSELRFWLNGEEQVLQNPTPGVHHVRDVRFQ